jgi:hypothetical protein
MRKISKLKVKKRVRIVGRRSTLKGYPISEQQEHICAPPHLVHGADGRVDDGALALDDVKGDVHAGQGGQDVREQDHAVGPEGRQRIQVVR